MNIRVPIFVEQRDVPDTPRPVFIVRPLLCPAPQRHGEELNRALTKLAQDLRKLLDGLARQPKQEFLAQWTFSPTIQEQRLSFSILLRRQTARVSLLVCAFEALGRRIAFIPQVPALWFDVPRGDRLRDRAIEMATEHFAKLEREDDEFVIPPQLSQSMRAFVTAIELDVHPAPKLPKKEENLFAFLGPQGAPDGRDELHKVGRCLDWMYPDDLERAVLREPEVEELLARLGDADKRPVLLLGPQKAGKTAIIHEAVYQRVSKLATPHVSKHNVWLLSPQRLISGMSYVGQWEGRLLAILKEAKKQDHVLYFDDVLGLFHAGVCASSDLSVAHVLRPYVERREFRMLAEMTGEAFRILQERDRGMADLFHIIRIRPTNEPQTRKIMVSAMRQLESQNRCMFDLDVLPTVLDLQQRYVRDLALPGKAAAFLRQLAVKHKQAEVTRRTVLEDFQKTSGLSVSFLDADAHLQRADVVKALGQRIVGQEAAVEAMADAVCTAKARLNDPGRPLATFLFLGPTGVGKTQCAKALAAHLFGEESRLARFDMNECIDAASVARLVGTFHQPEGLLTTALRRQPFCVLLLDEIEKADPAVFDLLLQVLGEGRLTDARGRTADFTNAIVIMTSNLGTREAASGFGLRPADQPRGEVYVHAAERFFRPEFFNRIDRIIPFEPLSRQHVARIAEQLIAGLFQRHGLVHRRCVLQVDPAAMTKIVDAGYHPQLGARALKRAIERQLAQPVAMQLAAAPPGAPAIVSLHPSRDGVAVSLDALTTAPANPPMPALDPETALELAEATLDRIEADTAAHEPAGAIRQDALSAKHFRYLAVREQIQRLDTLIQRIDRALRRKPSSPRFRPAVRNPRRTVKMITDHNGLAAHLLAEDSHVSSHLAELFEQADGHDEQAVDLVGELLPELALLDAMAAPGEDRAILFVRIIGDDKAEAITAGCPHYPAAFERQYGLSIAPVESKDLLPPRCRACVADMPGALRILQGEKGTQLFLPRHHNIVPVQVMVLPLRETEDPVECVRAHLRRREDWRTAVAAGLASASDDPWKLQPIIRIYDDQGVTVDVRTGLASHGLPTPQDLRRFILAQLPLPHEFLTTT